MHAYKRRTKQMLTVLSLALAALGGCGPKRPNATRVARALEVTTGDRELDRDLARLRSMQITVNESEREYLEILAALATRLSPTQDAELAALSNAVRRAADELHGRGKALMLELDVSGAEAVARDGDARTGCDQFAQPANVHRCQGELSTIVRVVFHERAVSSAEDAQEVDVEVRSLPASSEAFATATATAVAELAALRIRLGAVSEAAEPLRDRLRAARTAPRFERELREAIEFLEGVAARARVTRRQVTTAAESLANSAQRAAR